MDKGIDISVHNGIVDMKKVKDDGIDFVIIRLGYGINNLDKRFFENYKNARNNKIKTGVYFYSYACNENEARKEAVFVIKIIKNLKLDLPVFFDMEDADGYKRKRNVDDKMCIKICETFCHEIENAGYSVGIYANLDWLNNKLSSKSLEKYDKWVAQWGKKCTYDKKYVIWQYSSKGNVSGINGNVDMNYSYINYNNEYENNNVGKVNKYYFVKKGDSLIKIAKMYNINWKKLYEDNKNIIGNNPNYIIVGQKLIIKEQ